MRVSFRRLFWYGKGGYLYDTVDGDERDPSLRPNQILALRLPFPLLGEARARQVLDIVREKLLTPVGLRSLAEEDPEYKPRYEGGPWQRDGAYHQGTVWTWLLGPYVSVLLRYGGAAGRKEATLIFKPLESHFGEAGLCTVSEIFDGTRPHTPRGCVAQAWSVGELLRAHKEVLGW